jgi:hypothetical protein
MVSLSLVSCLGHCFRLAQRVWQLNLVFHCLVSTFHTGHPVK